MISETAPLASLDQWEDDLLIRYPEPEHKAKEEYRNYDSPERDTVREFYRLNHTYQTYDFVREKEQEFLKFDKKELPVWGAMEFLNTLVDDSDPDTGPRSASTLTPDGRSHSRRRPPRLVCADRFPTRHGQSALSVR